MTPGETAVRARVHGRVQGVGYRLATVRAASRLGLDGWCRNEADGTVSVWAQGDPAAVQALVDWLWTGPRLAEVTDIEVESVEPHPGLAGFTVR